MQIRYRNKRVEKDCTDYEHAKKKYPGRTPEEIRKAINFIEEAQHLYDVINYRPFHYHGREGHQKGFHSLDIGGRKSTYRLLFSLGDDVIDLFAEAKEIEVIVIERVDKHDKK